MVQAIVVSTTIPAMSILLSRTTPHLKAVQRNESHEPLGFNHPEMDLVKRLLQTGRTLLKKLSTSTMRVLLENALVVFFKFIDLLIKLAGMNTDHCSKEKKDARLLENLKAWAVDQKLGEDKMLDMPLGEVTEYFKKAEEKMIKKAGGQRKWKDLPDVKKAERKAAMIEEAVSELGKEAFNDLPDEEKRILRLFIWAGCGCHKDLNTVRGGYLAMVTWWNENVSEDVEPPVLLANRDNDPVVQERVAALGQGDIPTPAQERAFHTWGYKSS